MPENSPQAGPHLHAPDALNRIMALMRSDRLDEAEAALGPLVRTTPSASALVAYGALMSKRSRYAEAETFYRQAIATDPQLSAAHQALATVLDITGRFEAAIDAYEQALALDPQSPQLNANYGALLTRLGRMQAAEQRLEAAYAANPNLALSANNLGRLLVNVGEIERGIALQERAAALDPGYVSSILFMLHYDPERTAEAIAEAHFAWGRRLAPLAADRSAFANDRDPERKLRIGYVSPDFRSHSVGHAFAPVLRCHDRATVDVTLYGEIERPDGMTEMFKAAAQSWRSMLGVDDELAVAQIKADRIDILVDLAGHSGGNRLGIFARRAAPVQITWLGYPNTTGLASMDYRLVDAISDPDGPADRLASETLLRLPDGFIVGAPHPAAAQIAIPPSFRTGFITFGSLNNLTKVNRRVVALWARVLHAVPQSRLLLKSSFNTDEWVHDRLRAAFAADGIAAERLDFRMRSRGTEEHLALYNEIDIALDPFPYNGTMTSLECLHAGVPLITLLGDCHVARVGASLLTRIGHAEWIAADPDAYAGKATRLAGDRSALAAARMRLRQQYLASPLADAEKLTRTVEATYREVWRRWCAGEPMMEAR